MLQAQSALSASAEGRGRRHLADIDQPMATKDGGDISRVGDMEIRSCLIEGNPPGVRHSLHVGQAASLILVTSGEAELSQGGRHVTLVQEHWTLARGELLVAAGRQARIVTVQLGEDFSMQTAEQLRPFILRRQGGAGGAGHIVYLHALGMANMGRDISLGCSEELAAITAHLVRLALTEVSAVRPLVSMRETLRQRIRTYIERNLHDPQLSIDTIAARFNCSKRNLHKVFQEEGDTLNRFLWATRLDRCRRDLTDPVLRHRSITEIAFSWGFNSSAHFSRAFRGRFGITPRDLRN